MLERLAARIHSRRRRVLWGFLAVVLVAGFFGGPVFGLLDSSGDFDDPQAEAVLAAHDVERRTRASAPRPRARPPWSSRSSGSAGRRPPPAARRGSRRWRGRCTFRAWQT